ncbi:hypothetical protein F5B20DRAFT_241173 [Whalleya microplaca]|nr:hypothetical protein F5B20DRAFT_241173 [Whalleya microplaca]
MVKIVYSLPNAARRVPVNVQRPFWSIGLLVLDMFFDAMLGTASYVGTDMAVSRSASHAAHALRYKTGNGCPADSMTVVTLLLITIALSYCCQLPSWGSRAVRSEMANRLRVFQLRLPISASGSKGLPNPRSTRTDFQPAKQKLVKMTGH